MKDIKGVGFNIPTNDENDYLDLDSLSSLSECDIVIFNPSFENTSYSTFTGSYGDSKKYKGQPLYNDDSSTQITEHAKHWNREIKSFLSTGKTLFVVLSEKKNFYIHTGKQEFSGTGRNRQTTNIVTEFSNYLFLPKIDNLEFNVAQGKKIISTDAKFTSFLTEFSDLLSYETFIIGQNNLKHCFTTKNKDKVLGGIVEAFGGNIVFIPKMTFENEEYQIYDDEDNLVWSKEAQNKGIQFLKSIAEIDNVIRKSTEKTPKPTWIENDSYSLKKSLEIKTQIENHKMQIEKLSSQIQVLTSELVESEKLNDLLFETGKALENAVTYALTILGFKAENYDDGILELDQVIISPEGNRYIGECEGKENKAIDISKFRQLSDALNEDFEREEVTEKAYGILFGNPFRLTQPNERSDSFTDKCIKGAEREKVGLIETSKLYAVAKYLLENDDENYKKQCRETILKNLGKIIEFPKIDIK